MKRKPFYCLLLCVSLLVGVGTSCKKTAKETVSPIEEFQNSLSEADTTEILSISNKFMETMQAGNVDEALASLVMLDTANNVQPLPAEILESVKNTFKLFPVRSYTIQNYEFQKNDSNYVAYTYVALPATDNEPAVTMGFKTKPVKIDGKWYLTLPDYSTDSVQKADSIAE